jgi:hypothetical protein
MVEEKDNHQTDLQRKIRGANALKNYAINNKVSISDEVIGKIDAAVRGADKNDSDADAKLDMAIRELTKATYPATIETVLFQLSDKGIRHITRLKLFLCLCGVVSLLSAIAVYGFDQASPVKLVKTASVTEVSPSSVDVDSCVNYHAVRVSLLALCLGVLGASLFSMYNLIGIVNERALASEDSFSEVIRLVLGAIVGWVFFFAFSQAAFEPGAKVSNMLVLLPFLAGFSTKLVVGIINKAIQAVQMTLGLDDKTSELQERKVRSK